MSFARTPTPHVVAASRGAPVEMLVTAEDLAYFIRHADPFLIAHDCKNPSGHDPVASYGEVVCAHCARVFWR